MILVLIESALRSLALALTVWVGLRIFRVHNVVAEKLAWTVVLAAALAMPLLLPLFAQWPHLPAATLTLPAGAILPASLRENRQETMNMAAIPQAQRAPMATHRAGAVSGAAPLAAEPDPFSSIETASPAGDRFPAPTIEQTDQDAPPIAPVQNGALDLAGVAAIAYLAVAAALLFRLLFGLAATLSLWRSAEPVGESRFAAGLRVRATASVASPVTIGSGILLPADFAAWDSEKLRIVLAHERSHIRQGDFYLQLLANLYAAAVWVSPVGWWLKRKLSDLGEAIGDRFGLEEAQSCSSYAQVLLEFAAAPRPATIHPTMIGVAMARPSSLTRRIERLLNPSAFRQAFAGGRRAFLAAVLVPAALFAITALVRVETRVQAASQAAAQQQPAPSAQQPIAGQARPQAHLQPHPGITEPAPAPSAVPPASPTPGPSQAKPGPTVHVDIPALRIDVPAVHVDVPAKSIDIPAVNVDVPAQHFDVPAQQVDVPAVHVNVPAQHIDVPAIHVDVPAKQIDIPAKHIDVPPAGASSSSGYGDARGASGELYAMLSGIGRMFTESAPVASAVGAPLAGTNLHGVMRAANGSEAIFDRTLTFSGQLDLSVATGSGNIHLTRGTANQVRIHGVVRAHSGASEAEAREIAADPPIEQDGNTIRIGARRDENQRENMRHVSIDYEIEAPADARLRAASGSGDITDQGVGQTPNLITGSGNITATGVQGGFTLQTGSGDIAIAESGAGDAKAQTGSGNIDVKGVNGALKAQTGSGDIKIAGTPTADWKLETGSGNIELSPGNAPLTLDASTGSGSITAAHEMTMQTSSDRHRVQGQLNGGGPMVRIEAGSGDIRIN